MHKYILPSALALLAGGFAFAQVVPQPGPPTPIACAYNTSPPALTSGQAGWIQCDSSGRFIPSGGGTVSTATVGAQPSSDASAQLLAANAARQGLVVTNTDANVMYLKYGTTASSTSFTVAIPTGGYWEMPKPAYTGRIDVIWVFDGTGAAQYTEY